MGCGGSKTHPTIEHFQETAHSDIEEEDEEEETSSDIVARARARSMSGGYTLAMADASRGSGFEDSEQLTFGEKPSIGAPTSLFFYELKDEQQDSDLTIQNHEKDPVFFKIKITAPKNFSFRPKEGRILPNASVTLAVHYKPPTDDSPAWEPVMKAKVMVQAVRVSYTGGERLPYLLWNKAPARCITRKITKVIFTEPEDKEMDLTKFMSVTMPVDDVTWWKK